METRKRSLVKSLSWRSMGLVVTSLIAYIMTRQIDTAMQIGVVDLLFKVGVYYAHERFWTGVRWGQVRSEPDYEI